MPQGLPVFVPEQVCGERPLNLLGVHVLRGEFTPDPRKSSGHLFREVFTRVHSTGLLLDVADTSGIQVPDY